MLTLVHLRGVTHVYDSGHRRFVKKNATNVAQALGETASRSLRKMLAHTEWVADGVRKEGFVALRAGEKASRYTSPSLSPLSPAA